MHKAESFLEQVMSDKNGREIKCHIYSIVSQPFFFYDFSLSVNAPQLRIGVIRKGLILQVSFTRKACEAYSATRGQCEHIPMIILCVDFTVGKNLRSLFPKFIHIQYEIKALYCGVEEGEMSNLAAQ
jgi:hypothetical protein